MSTHKHINKICCAVLAFVLILTILFVNAEKLGVLSAETYMGYATRLFDTSYVHTINIVMDDWDEFIDTCENEEYEICSVIIDNDVYKNVAIRAKGNTSLSSVKSYGNGRYSFKIEFDHYDNTNTYYGLDKLSLNNIIQDNTYMKDYLSYQMMNYFDVDSPLCSYVYITVNSEDWGLYLAVEGIEESFLERNYGSNYGELYKPDSMNMGAGRGNGNEFNMEDVEAFFNTENSLDTQSIPDNNIQFDNDVITVGGNMSPNVTPPVNGFTPDDNFVPDDGIRIPENGGMPNGQDIQPDNRQRPDRGAIGVGRSMGEDDVSLIYSDDNYESYSNIFDNAKTDITDSDKDRLIESIRQLNEGENIEEVVDIDEVIRYFVVHNFVCNFDSYTGSMIHNYYLYEKDGMLFMIPWDYNLAYGGFESSSDATSLVNYPIDSPVSGGTVESRPMLAWIFASEEYTQLYHQYFSEFISEYFNSGYFQETIDSTIEMISLYVQKDPTKFCTYEQFKEGAETLKKFCLLRSDSIQGQLSGEIPSTSDGQNQDNSTLIDASSLTISSMGSMGNMGPGENRERLTDAPQNNEETMSNEQMSSSESSQILHEGTIPGDNEQGENQQPNGMKPPDNAMGDNFPDINMPTDDNRDNMPDMNTTGSQTANNMSNWIMLGVSAVILILGLFIAFKFKR